MTKWIVAINFGVHIFLYGVVMFSPDGRAVIEGIYNRYGLTATKVVEDGFFWQPFTSMFLHGFVEVAAAAKEGGGYVEAFYSFFTIGMLHVGVNMLALWSIGGIIEKSIGPLSFLFLYLCAGLFGSMGVVLGGYDLTHPTVGASGAVVGLLGALAALFPRTRLVVFFIPMRASTAAWAVGIISLLFMFSSFTGMISHAGHLGGLIGGVIYIYLYIFLFFRKESISINRLFRDG